MAEGSDVFELRSASMTLVALVLRSAELAVVEAALASELGPTPELFSDDAVVIDLAQLDDPGAALDFGALMQLLRTYRMVPVAVRGGSSAQMAAALAAGLAHAPAGGSALLPRESAVGAPAAVTADTPDASTAAVAMAPEMPSEPPVVDPGNPAEAAELDRKGPALRVARVVDKPLRSGQQVYARGGDLVVLAAVNFGAEVIADGSIHVYAPLRGKAIAGAKGNTAARIFSTCLDAELVSIAGTYRTTENPLPSEVAGKPAQIRLEGDRLVFEPLV